MEVDIVSINLITDTLLLHWCGPCNKRVQFSCLDVKKKFRIINLVDYSEYKYVLPFLNFEDGKIKY